ncbi:glucosyltransferase domain-containing protein [Subdoligranulum variabile]|nr:glucosyltransferase domain-containing protein [Subdoligranulum variabile]UWP69364.1 glucosyltransferase domain-containing protein [Subdoligranulum variabile]
MQWWKLEAPERRRFALLAGGGLIYVLPILLADRYYQDDLARAVYGAGGWVGDGRPLTEWIMELLAGGGSTVIDVSPLPLLLGVAVLAYAMTLYARQAFPALRGSALATVSLGFVLTNPFALANLSYKFDCLTMLLAVAICFVLYALPATLGGPRLAVAGAVCAVLVMSLYQPGAGMFLVLAGVWGVFWLVDWLGSGEPLRGRLPCLWPEVWRLGGIGAGALVYLKGIAPRLMNQEGWQQNASQTVGGIGALRTMVSHLLEGARYIETRLLQFPVAYRTALLLAVAGAVAAALWRFWRQSKAAPVRKLLGCLLLLAAPFAVLLASYLPLTALQSVPFAPRLLLAAGGAMLFIGLLWLRALPHRRAVAGVLLGACLFCQFCYGYAYGNALKCQKDYEVYLVTQIAHDCETINSAETYDQLSFMGDPPSPRQMQQFTNMYPLFGELILPYFNNSNWIGGAWVYHYLQHGLKIVDLTDADKAACTDENRLLQNSLYDCYRSGNKILISFR